MFLRLLLFLMIVNFGFSSTKNEVVLILNYRLFTDAFKAYNGSTNTDLYLKTGLRVIDFDLIIFFCNFFLYYSNFYTSYMLRSLFGFFNVSNIVFIYFISSTIIFMFYFFKAIGEYSSYYD